MSKIVLFVIFLLPTFLYSQESNVFVVKNKLHIGEIVNNYFYSYQIPKTKKVVINELFFGYKFTGNKHWHKIYNYPEVGLSFFTGSFGNNEKFGHVFGLAPKLNLKIFSIKKSSLEFSGGVGFAYITKYYNSQNNKENIIIGSNINSLSTLSLNYNYDISNRLGIDFGVSAFHFSNGHYQIPNVGINVFSGIIGFKYRFSDVKISEKKYENSYNNKVKFNFDFGAGMHELATATYPIGTPKFPIYSVSFLLSKNYNNVSKFVIGASGRFYTSYYNRLKIKEIQDASINSFVITLNLGHEILIGNFGLFSYGGINIYNPFNKQIYGKYFKGFDYFSYIYLRTNLGIKYYFNNPKKYNKINYFVALSITANFLEADFPKLSLGFLF